MGGVWGRCLPSARYTHTPPSCQVKIFEEDFQRERSDRERMNEEKEELKQQLEKLQKQLVLSSNQVSSTGRRGQHPGSPASPPGTTEVLVPYVMALVPISEQWLRWDRLARVVVLLPLDARASPVTRLFLLPPPGSLMGGGECTGAGIPVGHCSIPCPTDKELAGWALH